jgi:hypothetical protein
MNEMRAGLKAVSRGGTPGEARKTFGDERRDSEQRGDVGGAAACDRLTRHPEHDTRMLILRNGLRTCLAKRHHAVGAVLAHPGQQHRDDWHPSQPRERLEEHIDGGPLMVDGRPIRKPRCKQHAVALHKHMAVARRDVSHARFQTFAALRFDYPYRARRVEAVGERAGEVRRSCAGR